VPGADRFTVYLTTVTRYTLNVRLDGFFKNSTVLKFEFFYSFNIYLCTSIHGLCQIKALPLQAWSGPEGSRKLRFPNYMTTAQDGGKVVSLTHRPLLPPGNAPVTHFC